MSSPNSGYVPPPSIGHEMGVMFGFIGLILVVFIGYTIAYNIYYRRLAKADAERTRALKAQGLMDEKTPLDAPVSSQR